MEDVPYGRILREGWSIILVAAVLCSLAAWGVTKALPQTYTASSTLMLQVDSSQTSLFERNQFSMARIKTYPALVDSQEVIDGVRADLGLSPEEFSDSDLQGLLSAEIKDDTVLMKVIAEAPEAQLSADIANSAARHLSQLLEKTENIDGDKQAEVALEQVLVAVAPASPASPNVTAITGLGLISGFALGAIFAVYRTTTNRRLLTVADVRKASGLAVAGQLPRPRRQGVKGDSLALAPYQETVGNLVTLGGAERRFYAVVPASSMAFDDETLTGLLEAYESLGTHACVVDVRSSPVRTRDARRTEAAPAGEGRDAEVLEGPAEDSLLTADVPVSTREAVESFLDEVRILREDHDVVILVCDSSSTMLLEHAARRGAGVVIAVRHNLTLAADLNAVVTRQRVQGIRPVGVFMIHTPRGFTENVAETWRVSDRELLEVLDRSSDENWVSAADGPRQADGRSTHALGRGRRAG